MKRFLFPLQPVAVLRAHRELRARQEFAAAVGRLRTAEEELVAVRRHVARYAHAVCAARHEGLAGLSAGYSAVGYARECRAEEAAAQSVEAARQEMERCRREYLDARRRLEVVRRLEQKARRLHRAAELQEEQAAFDESSNGRQARAVGLTHAAAGSLAS